MPPVIYAAPNEGTSPVFCEAFAAGCGGAKIINGGPLYPGDVALFGSPQLWELLVAAKNEGRHWFYGDHAYFKKGRFYRITKNAFMTTKFAKPRPQDYARFDALGLEIKPKREGGRHILICPPSTAHIQMMKRAGIESPAEDFDGWARAELAKYTDRPIQTRWKRAYIEGRPLESDLKDCWAVVVFTSNVGVLAALAGIPVFAVGPCASRLFGTEDLSAIEANALPEDRRSIAAFLSSQQWSLEEIRRGRAWEALQ